MAMKEYGLYIDGAYVKSCSGRYIEVENPATKEVFARVPDGNGDDVDRAVAAARKAFPAWSALSPQERADYLDRFADIFRWALKKGRGCWRAAYRTDVMTDTTYRLSYLRMSRVIWS